jgi:hypothetical protein
MSTETPKICCTVDGWIKRGTGVIPLPVRVVGLTMLMFYVPYALLYYVGLIACDAGMLPVATNETMTILYYPVMGFYLSLMTMTLVIVSVFMFAAVLLTSYMLVAETYNWALRICQ